MKLISNSSRPKNLRKTTTGVKIKKYKIDITNGLIDLPNNFPNLNQAIFSGYNILGHNVETILNIIRVNKLILTAK